MKTNKIEIALATFFLAALIIVGLILDRKYKFGLGETILLAYTYAIIAIGTTIIVFRK